MSNKIHSYLYFRPWSRLEGRQIKISIWYGIVSCWARKIFDTQKEGLKHSSDFEFSNENVSNRVSKQEFFGPLISNIYNQILNLTPIGALKFKVHSWNRQNEFFFLKNWTMNSEKAFPNHWFRKCCQIFERPQFKLLCLFQWGNLNFGIYIGIGLKL